ncbi:hypothetical protein OH77DRAFT_1503667 [Trametes cingulata]|nr:hypothetical protein OH77DRAFT_1503667 [Trametes cingulata]
MDSEFSSNRHASPLTAFQVPIRHPELCFEDGNLAVVTGPEYFVVHRGLLSRHSELLRKRLVNIKEDTRLLEGHPVLTVDDDAQDFAHFLRALYGRLTYDDSLGSFPIVSAILRLATKYEVSGLRANTIRTLSLSWPTTLAMWEVREKAATNSEGMYAPRPNLAHPLLIIKLAREVGAHQLLPSAFYDLSRYLPSQLMEGYIGPDGVRYYLPDDELCRVLRGKEHGARFFSTFIVTELEGRGPSVHCLHRNEVQPALKRACQMAFEAVTFELIRDVNGMVCNRNSDPLFTIADSVLMQTRDDQPGVENKAAYRACEACRMDYAAVVQAAREEFWRHLPAWFELTEVKNWV